MQLLNRYWWIVMLLSASSGLVFFLSLPVELRACLNPFEEPAPGPFGSCLIAGDPTSAIEANTLLVMKLSLWTAVVALITSLVGLVNNLLEMFSKAKSKQKKAPAEGSEPNRKATLADDE